MLIAFEGIDGSGKGTHSQLFCERMHSAGFKTKLFSFPNYKDTFFGHEVGRYLDGCFGGLDTVPVEFASILYAGDRFELRSQIIECLDNDIVVVCDRYTPSNLAHQGGKVSINERDHVLNWIEKLEYSVFNLPKPDVVFWLDMPVVQAMEFVAQKSSRLYTDKSHDLHEASLEYLEKVRDTYEYLSCLYGWVRVGCCDERLSEVKCIDEIQNELYEKINLVVNGTVSGEN